MKRYIVKCCLMTLAGFQLAGLPSCSNADSELETVVNGEATRVTLVEKKIEDLVAGTLSTRLTDEEKASVQRLVLAGTFNAADVDCLRKELPALIELDMTNIRIVDSEMTYNSYTSLNANQIGEYMFSDMGLQVIKLPSTIEVICRYAFNRTQIATLEIPSSVTTIQNNAFQSCSKLTEIVIPASVINVEDRLFSNCENLETVKFLAAPADNTLPDETFYQCSKLKNLELSESINKVASHCFNGCTSLTDYTVFQNIDNISYGAFGNCGFETIDLSNVTFMESDAFSNCANLVNVTLPQSMTILPNSLFSGCKSLKQITLLDNLEEIGSSAFSNTSLESIILPEGLKTIGSSAFTNTLLTEVNFPASLKTIGYEAFAGTKLKELIIPENVTTVESNIVSGCRQLTALFWNTSVTPIPYCYNVNPNCLLYVNLSESSIAADPSWKNLIMDGKATSIQLEFSNDSYNPSRFNCPQEFVAEKISYTMNFQNNYMEIGTSSNWNTLTLPFAPSAITHESKGTMAPFGSDVEGAKPFWLRKLGTEGFANATTIEPNVPYIIAVPNNPNIYLDEYNLAGKVTFSAENVTISKTPVEPVVLEGPNYSMHSNYEYQPADVTVYALNTDYYVDGYNYGSIFIRGIIPVYAFQAYVKSNSAASRVIPISTKAVGSRTKTAVNTTGIPCVDDM